MTYLLIRECGSTLYVGMTRKQNGRPCIACSGTIPELTNKEHITFKKYIQVVLDDYLLTCVNIVAK